MIIERILEENHIEVSQEVAEIITKELNIFLDSSGIDEADDLHQMSGVRITFEKEYTLSQEETHQTIPLGLSYSILKHGEEGQYQSKIEREGKYIVITMNEDGSLLYLQGDIDKHPSESLIKWLRETYHMIFKAYEDPTINPKLKPLRYWSKKDSD